MSVLLGLGMSLVSGVALGAACEKNMTQDACKNPPKNCSWDAKRDEGKKCFTSYPCNCRLAWYTDEAVTNAEVKNVTTSIGTNPSSAKECASLCKTNADIASKCNDLLTGPASTLKAFCPSKDKNKVVTQSQWGEDPASYQNIVEGKGSVCGTLNCGTSTAATCPTGCFQANYQNTKPSCQKTIYTLPSNGSGESDALKTSHTPTPGEWFIYEKGVFQFCSPAVPVAVEAVPTFGKEKHHNKRTRN